MNSCCSRTRHLKKQMRQIGNVSVYPFTILYSHLLGVAFFKSKQQRQQGLWLGIARSHKLKWIVWLLAWDAAASRLDWKLLCGQRNMVGRVRWSQVRSVGKYVCNMTILFMYVYTYVYISYMIYQHHYRKILTSSDAHLKFMRNIPRFCPFSEVYPKESVDPSHLAPFGEPADAFST